MNCNHDFGTGPKICHCAGCHRTFTGISAFNAHQTLRGDNLTCIDPATATHRDGTPRFAAWRKTPDGQPVWGRALRPGEDPTAHVEVWRAASQIT